MGRVNHDPLRSEAIPAKGHEDLVKYAQPAPAHETVVECLMRAVGLGRILPLQTVADHVDDSADHPLVINPRPWASGKWGDNRAI